MSVIRKEGPVLIDGQESYVCGRDGRRDAQEGWRITERPYRPEPTDDELRDLSTDGASCLLAGNRVLMEDGTWRPVETLKAGDRLRAMSGRADAVRRIEHTRLGPTRRVIELRGHGDECLFVSDEHPLWVSRRQPDGGMRESWGTYNLNHLLYEMRGGAEYALREVPVPLAIDLPEQLAHLGGWVHVRPIYHHLDPSTALYNIVLEEEFGFFAEGFALFSQARREQGPTGAWRGLRVDGAARAFVQRLADTCA